MAGRILLIFEGFDEIDLTGDTDARMGHFRSLWECNYERSKIIITGRPNFFLDSKEITRALGDDEQSHTLYLAPFNLSQIEHSLRCVDRNTTKEILLLAKNDSKFKEVVARPSLLHIVAVLWQREQLSAYANKNEHLNAAFVMNLFIKHTLQRQQEKHDLQAFMALNSAERLYFMSFIAACMAASDLPNQITVQQLESAVLLGIDAIPDAVSRSVTTLKNEDSLPLRSQQRADWEHKSADVINRIQTDVRSCGLLVTDLSKSGTFKFAHKSFLEFLQAQIISLLFSTDEVDQVKARSISNSWNLKIENLQSSKETIGFLAELLKLRLHEQGAINGPETAKGLFDILVIGKLATNPTFFNLLTFSHIRPAILMANVSITILKVNGRARIFQFWSLATLVMATILGAAIAIAYEASALSGSLIGLHVSMFIMIVQMFGPENFRKRPRYSRSPFYALLAMGFTIFLSLPSFPNVSAKLTESLLLSLPNNQTILSIVVICTLLTLPALTVRLLFSRISKVFPRLCLWYHACCDLQLTSNDINGVVGKGMKNLLMTQHTSTDGIDKQRPVEPASRLAQFANRLLSTFDKK
jgi:hypothetical protein